MELTDHDMQLDVLPTPTSQHLFEQAPVNATPCNARLLVQSGNETKEVRAR